MQFSSAVPPSSATASPSRKISNVGAHNFAAEVMQSDKPVIIDGVVLGFFFLFFHPLFSVCGVVSALQATVSDARANCCQDSCCEVREDGCRFGGTCLSRAASAKGEIVCDDV